MHTLNKTQSTLQIISFSTPQFGLNEEDYHGEKLGCKLRSCRNASGLPNLQAFQHKRFIMSDGVALQPPPIPENWRHLHRRSDSYIVYFVFSHQIQSKQNETMIDDQDLGFFANFLGIFIFVLVIAYHYVMADPKYEGS
ncbi:Oligosaccaryltransferase [Parasponia andersonii]|uniref:Oligosaccaryltransferase n=1 Tax=Parasponia andersonii TaxID=3476 RepID=A0A2P5C6D2_PARAD|nr:Oligosaccaryltransferase [Parasponia andersonii]